MKSSSDSSQNNVILSNRFRAILKSIDFSQISRKKKISARNRFNRLDVSARRRGLNPSWRRTDLLE